MDAKEFERFRQALEDTQELVGTLLAACHAAHELLYHYNLAQQPNGVEWGSVEMLRSEVLATLWYAITQAQPELVIPD